MALVTFTNCGAKLNTKNPMAPGKKVGCPKCKMVFVVQDEAPAATEEVAAEAPPSVPEKATSPARHDDESIKEGTAPPSIAPTKPAARDDDDRDDPDEPPRNKRRDADDSDEEPAQKRTLAKDLPRTRTPYLAIAGVVALGILSSVMTVAVCVISMERDRVPRHPKLPRAAVRPSVRKRISQTGPGSVNCVQK